MTLRFCILLVFASMFNMAQAQHSNSSLSKLTTTYEDYKEALEVKNYQLAYGYAQSAWELSESIYGDSQQTGDFAYNFAVIASALAPADRRDKRAEKGFIRSLELTQFHGDNASIRRLERLQKYASYWQKKERRKKAAELYEEAVDYAQSAPELLGTKNYARLRLGQGQLALIRGKYSDAEQHIINALDVYRELGVENTKESRRAHLSLGHAYFGQKKWKPAFISYQTVWLNSDRVLEMTDPHIGKAYVRSMTIPRKRSDSDIGLDRAGLYCASCWPNFDDQSKALTDNAENYVIERTAPEMPSAARTSAFVVIQYDTNAQGAPENFRIIAASHRKTFDDAAGASVKNYRVYEKDGKTPAANVKDLTVRLTFMLSTYNDDEIDFHGGLAKE